MLYIEANGAITTTVGSSNILEFETRTGSLFSTMVDIGEDDEFANYEVISGGGIKGYGFLPPWCIESFK